MTKIFLEMEGYDEVTRERDYSDEWGGEDTSTTWTFGEFYLAKGHSQGYRDVFETDFDVKPGDLVFGVVAVWSDGDSFSSRRDCNAEVFGVFNNLADAEKFEAAVLLTDDYLVKRDGGDLKKISGLDINFPWYNYFENLSYTKIITSIVRA